MGEHERWLRSRGLGRFVDNKPAFLDSCLCDGDNMDKVCGVCEYSVECAAYFQPLAEALSVIRV